MPACKPGKKRFYHGKIVSIIEDQEPVHCISKPLLYTCKKALALLQVGLRTFEKFGQDFEVCKQIFLCLGSDPENRLILLAITIGIRHSRLCFAKSTKTGQCLDRYHARIVL